MSVAGGKVEESKSSLFAESDEDEDLFASSQSKTASGNLQNWIDEKTFPNFSLLIFFLQLIWLVAMETPASKPKPKSSLFDEDDEKDELFDEEIPKKGFIFLIKSLFNDQTLQNLHQLHPELVKIKSDQ